MPRYGSNDRRSLKIGISSFSEEKTSLEVVGRIGVGTDAAVQNLDVRGTVYVSNDVGIGTTVPGDAVNRTNTSKLSVGIVTANEYYGSGLGLTGITSATNATNIYGGAAGQLLYQAQPGITSAFENGQTGYGLFSRGVDQPPQWLPTAPAGAVEGILVFDEGAAVGLGTTFNGLDFRGLQVVATGENGGGIATITVNQQTFVEVAGVATNVIGGIASVTQLNVDAGISSFSDFKITSLTSGVGATVGASAGVATYYGTGIELSGIVTTITAGNNINIDRSTGNVTINAAITNGDVTADQLFISGISTLGIITGNGGNAESIGVTTAYIDKIVGTSATFTTLSADKIGVGTDNPLNTFQAGLGNSSFTVVSTATTTMVGVGTTNPKFTLDVKGDTNIDGSVTVNGQPVASIGLIVALGGL